VISGKTVDPRSQHVVEPGGTVLIRTPAGGGYGPAAERDPELTAADRAEGYV
jgi:N-methylhydantoinase B